MQFQGDMLIEGSGDNVKLQLLVENMGHLNYDRFVHCVWVNAGIDVGQDAGLSHLTYTTALCE